MIKRRLIVKAAPTPVAWRVRPPTTPELAERLARALGVPVVAAAVLAARGFTDPLLFDPPLRLSRNPALPLAARRIIEAIQAGKRIRVHGDYDADGITASSVLVRGLTELGAKVHAFIPNRLIDGYGINPGRVDEHVAACDLLVTVDCGVSNFAEVERLCAAGVEVIVTDHHAPPRELPGCLVVHPHLNPDYRPGDPALTGSGVAFHLLWAVRDELGLTPPLDYADLACIGAIADVAPLVGENRALAKAGLERLPHTRWPGLRALMNEQGLHGVTARDVAFVLAPRINAAGRLGEAGLALELLTTDDSERAGDLSRTLEGKNSLRKQIQLDMFEQAMEAVDNSGAAIVVSKDVWHAGIMGIVASRLQETFNKPVFIMAGGRGSVRSLPGVSAVGALRHASEMLDRFGGHEAAAGFSLRDGAEPGFRRLIQEYVSTQPSRPASVTLDALLDPRDANIAFLEGLEAAGPFGVGNQPAAFGVTGVLSRVREMGAQGSHLSFTLGDLRGVGFGLGGDGWSNGQAVNVEATLQRNVFRGQTSLEWSVTRIRKTQPLSVELMDNTGSTKVERVSAMRALDEVKSCGGLAYATGPARAFVQDAAPLAILVGEEAATDLGPVTILTMPEPGLVRAWLRRGIALRFALTDRTLSGLEDTRFWTLSALKSNQHRPGLPPKAERLLRELGEALSASPGAAYAACPELLVEEREAYRTRQFCLMYRFGDDVAFSASVVRLYGEPESVEA